MKTTLNIQNLKCGGCENTIITKISSLNHIENVSINHEDASITFEHLADEDVEVVKKELSKLGYPALGEDNNLGKKAKSYISCAIGKIQK